MNITLKSRPTDPDSNRLVKLDMQNSFYDHVSFVDQTQGGFDRRSGRLSRGLRRTSVGGLGWKSGSGDFLVPD